MTPLASIIRQKSQQWFANVLNTLLPSRCFHCGEIVQGSHQLCAACWKALDFITSPYCDRCGHPFIVDESYMICAACIASPPPFIKGRAAFQYDSLVRESILRFKHADATHLAKPFGKWLHRAATEILPYCDAIIPVPLHRFRLFRRGYNQATLLAREVSNLSSLPLLTNALIRAKYTDSQQRKSRLKREKNVQSVFTIAPPYLSVVKRKSFLLIDDVWTTGATLNACVNTLKKAGVKDVFVLTLARVIKTR